MALFQFTRIIVPATIELSDAGIVVQSQPEARRIDLAWRDVRAAERTPDGLVLTVAPMATNFTRDFPKRYLVRIDPGDPKADALWELCYRHLVASAGLVRTSGLRRIANTVAS